MACQRSRRPGGQGPQSCLYPRCRLHLPGLYRPTPLVTFCIKYSFLPEQRLDLIERGCKRIALDIPPLLAREGALQLHSSAPQLTLFSDDRWAWLHLDLDHPDQLEPCANLPAVDGGLYMMQMMQVLDRMRNGLVTTLGLDPRTLYPI